MRFIGRLNWYKVRLADGRTGFVSKRWTTTVSSGTGPGQPPPVAGAPTFTMDVVDVGTGLGILVRGADFTLVYDAGSNDDLARGAANRMLAFMSFAAPTTTAIDHLILSHPHRDHVELPPDLFATYQVRQVWDSGRVNDICGYRKFLEAVRDEPSVAYHNALQDFGTRGYAFGASVKCCASELASQVMVVGHHGSRTSSRRALLDAVGASTFIVSSGPTKYATVTLPDADVIAELTSRGQVFRTDTNDSACATNAAKIGPDNDGHAGGCDNIRVVIGGTPAVQTSVFHATD